jgi:3-dehydroquinate synthase
MPPIRIDVPTPSRRYSVFLEDGLLDRVAALLDELKLPARRFVVSSPLVWRLHGARIARGARRLEPILVPDGERSKHLQTVSRIYDALVKATADRSSTLITFGGGVIGDMAGYAASTYLRGIPLVHIPTTLLAQVDSAIGGKVGVNHPLGKNLIGSFFQPHAVLIDPSVLASLPRREFRAGLYEVIKYGMTSSRPLFDRIASDRKAIFDREPSALMPIITESCQIKASVVSQDEKESGLRRILNFGHTAGHAIEAVTKYKRFRHGEAVAYGMLVAAQISAARGALASTDQRALADLITSLGPLPSISDLPTAQMLEAIHHDKKVVAGTLHFVLPTAIGAWTIVDDVTEKEIRAALLKLGFRK